MRRRRVQNAIAVPYASGYWHRVARYHHTPCQYRTSCSSPVGGQQHTLGQYRTSRSSPVGG
eukprot:2773241-Rhodomonas_salina.1